ITDELVAYVAGGSASVDLSGWSGSFAVRWYDPVQQTSVTKASVTGGGARSLAPPFSPAVLHLKRTSGSGSLSTGRITGRIVHDVNGNGVRDSGEVLIAIPNTCASSKELSGVRVSWTGVQAGSAEPKLCDPGPYYASGQIPTGTYTVQVSAPTGWQVTSRQQVGVTVAANVDTSVWFGVRQATASSPSVSISTTGITAGATLTGPTKVTAQVTSNRPVQRVNFYLDGYLVRGDWSSPYSLAESANVTQAYDFAARGHSSGAHTLKVVVTVTDTDGSSVSVSKSVSFTLQLGTGGDDGDDDDGDDDGDDGGGGAATFSLSKTAMSFTGRAGEYDVAPWPNQSTWLSVQGGAVTWTARTDRAWLRVYPGSSSSMYRVVAVYFRNTGLSRGTHTGHVIFEAPGAAPVQVTVTAYVK
ncbi:MAG: Ig-like domain-containing protein, partial [Gemmatimonadota bacterium]